MVFLVKKNIIIVVSMEISEVVTTTMGVYMVIKFYMINVN